MFKRIDASVVLDAKLTTVKRFHHPVRLFNFSSLKSAAITQLIAALSITHFSG